MEPSWNLVGSIRRTSTKLYSGSKKLRSTCSGNIHPIRRTLPLIGWEQSSPVDEEERRVQMDDASVSILHSLRRELPYFLPCGRRSLVSGIQNDIVVSWTTLWEMIKVYWLDFSLHKDHTVCCSSTGASWGWTLHLFISQLRTKQSSSNCPNQSSASKNSIKKRNVVRRTVRSMLGEQTFAQLRTGLTS